MMRNFSLLLLGGIVTAATPALAETPSAQTKLDRVLEGHVAGEPVDCVNLRRVRSTQIIDGDAIVFDTGRTLYLNRPSAGQRSLSRWDMLVTDTHSSQLCSIDVVRLYDRGSNMPSGVVFLSEFIPYTPAKENAGD